MRKIAFGKQKVAVQGSPWALMVYSREFATEDGPADWYADLTKAVENARAGGALDPFFLLKTAWAMARNVDDDFPDYEEWLRPLDISVGYGSDWGKAVTEAIFAELFRQEPPKEAEAEPEA